MGDDSDLPPLSGEFSRLDPSLESVTDQAAPGAGGSQSSQAPGGDPHTDGDRNAMMTVAMLVVAALAAAVARKWPATAYTSEEKEALALVLVPVLLKWDLRYAWLIKWREEAALVGTLAMLATTGLDRMVAAARGKPAAAPGGAAPAGGASPAAAADFV
jgi:hypothetical protein